MAELLSVSNLSKAFGGIRAVDNVSFSIAKDEILGFIGPNGSGKSTCVNLISGVYAADTGRIVYEGRGINQLSIAERSRIGIGRTFQSPRPFIGLTVFDSIYTIAMQSRSFVAAKKKHRRFWN